MTIGDKIRKIRILKDIKQETIAEKLGISAQAYSKLERDTTKMDVHRLASIAELFGMTVDDIERFDDAQIWVHLTNCENGQGSYHIVNNHYHQDSNSVRIEMEKVIEQYQKIIEQQQEIIKNLQEQLFQHLNRTAK